MKLHRQSFWLPGSLSLFCLVTSPLQAQVVQDATLASPSMVTTNDNTSVITGGTQAGPNLFHSFREFSVPTGGSASFQQINQGIENVISRVTGSSVSNIDGLIEVLRANGTVSSANFFLLNPNGIIFGPNASLNIGGSFLASTASSLNFADGTQFSATAHPTTPLLTVSVPLGLQFEGTAGSILNQSQASPDNATNSFGLPIGLQVQTGKTLALVGGNVALEGGNLTVAVGRIELGSVAGSGVVSLNSTDKGWTLGYGGVQNFGDIQLSQLAFIDASGEGSGDIQVQGGRVTLDESYIFADTLGSQNGGEIFIRALQLNVENRSLVTARTFSSGKGGNVTIETGKLLALDGGQVSAVTAGEGPGGNLEVIASDSVELVGSILVNNVSRSSGLLTQTEEETTGAGGNLSISTGKLSVRDGAQVSSTTSGVGNAGDLTVRASKVELVGAAISADGQLLTNQNGLPFPSGLFAGTNIGSRGDGGTLTVETEQLSLWDGAVVQSSTLGEGNAGDLTVQATESVELIGTAKGSRIPTSLLAVSGGIPGLGGVLEATGQGGDLKIETGELIVQDGAAVAVGSINQASDALGAGNLEVQAQTIRLDNEGELTAATASGQGGDITLDVQDLLLLRRNSEITTTAGIAGAGGNGGNITIDTTFIVAFPEEDSDITANAFTGAGGRVEITAQGVFGLKSGEELTSSSDITAFSEQNIELNGVVRINTPDVDPSQGLVALPAEVIDVSGLIANSCIARSPQQGGSFIITGAGALPTRPGDASVSPYPTGTVRPVPNGASTSSISGIDTRPWQLGDPIVEAQGVYRLANGQLVLSRECR